MIHAAEEFTRHGRTPDPATLRAYAQQTRGARKDTAARLVLERLSTLN